MRTVHSATPVRTREPTPASSLPPINFRPYVVAMLRPFQLHPSGSAAGAAWRSSDPPHIELKLGEAETNLLAEDVAGRLVVGGSVGGVAALCPEGGAGESECWLAEHGV